MTATPDPIIDAPGFHGMFMVGTETLYLSHMPMFTVEKHMYQVILRATLPDDVMSQYVKGRAADPTLVYNLVNSSDDAFALPELKAGRRTTFRADVYAKYSNEDAGPVGDPFATGVTVKVDQLTHFRHFNSDIPWPQHLTYMIFGVGSEAHLSHYIARDPDYQHIMTLGAVPDWLDADQLSAGAALTFPTMSSQPVPCSSPLTASSYDILFEGRPDAPATLDLSGAVPVWFSTGNMLNSTDPCSEDAGPR